MLGQEENITPFRKITVTKTLVIPKITRLFMNLPDPDKRFLHDLNLLSPFLIGRTFLREHSWEYSANIIGS